MIIPKKHQKYLKAQKRLMRDLEREQEAVFNDTLKTLNITDQHDDEVLFDYLYNDFENDIIFER